MAFEIIPKYDWVVFHPLIYSKITRALVTARVDFSTFSVVMFFMSVSFYKLKYTSFCMVH